MVPKTYASRAFKKPFRVSLPAFVLAFLLAFQPLSIFAQELPATKDVPANSSSTVEVTRPEISDPSKEILGTSTETKPEDPTRPDPNVPADPESKPDPTIEEKPTDDEKPSEPEDDGHEETEDPEEENRDSGAPQPTIQTQVVSENVKREKTVNLKDGSLSYEYGLSLPSGRNLTPSVSLVYNSNNRKTGSLVGTGWSLDIPYIERLNKTGSEQMYTNDYFSSSLTGELVLDNGTEYVSKVDNGEFFSYEYDSDFWIAYDKDGTKYTFGENTDARQDDPNDSSRIYKWMIEEIRDTNDNYIKFEYYKDAGQIYPLVITYTGNGTTDGIFEVIFERESVMNPVTLYDTGFAVTTNDRINEIRTEIDSDWARKYELAYTAGDNGEEVLLDTITESGIDESMNTVMRDPIDFDYSDVAPGWTYDANWTSPLSFIENGDYGMRMVDLNGDGLLDIICSKDEINVLCGNNNLPPTYINNGNGFTTSSSWSALYFVDDDGYDRGVRLIDVDGDGLSDLIWANGTDNEVYINDGSNWVLDTSWALPLPVIDGSGNGNDYGMRMADFNGDGLVDIICQNDNVNGLCNTSNLTPVYFNTGSGWDPGTWGMPEKQDEPSESESFTDTNNNDNGLHIADINGDGLADLIRGQGTNLYVYINNGSGWEYDADWEQPLPFTDGGDDIGMRMEDINADGLIDIICQNETVNDLCNNNNATPVYLNNGAGWTQVTWGMPPQYNNTNDPEAFVGSSGNDKGLRFADMNGDGVVDLVRGHNADDFVYMSNSTTKSDLLSKITYPEGGSTEISYKGTPQFVDGNGDLMNPDLPMVNIVVSQTEDDDNNGNVEVRDYEYAGGIYYFADPLDRKFAGFTVVTEADSVGNITKTYFHQGNDTESSMGEYDDQPSKIGKPYRIEKYDNNSNLYDLSVSKWEEYEIVPGAHFVYNSVSTNLTYDGDSDHRDTAVQYEFNTGNGNLVSKTSYGEVGAATDGTFTDTENDMMVEEYSYAVDSNGIIKSKVSSHTVTNQTSNVVREEKFYYDGQSFGGVVLGNLTKEERLISGTDYAETNKTYDGTYGLVIESYDPFNNMTEYSYDAHNLYSETVTNALSQATVYEYDYSSGKPVNITDPNGTQKEYVYDGFDRIIEEKESSQTSATTLLTKNEYAYDDTSGHIAVTKTEHFDGTLDRDIHQYFDGFGRLIQERAKSEATNTFNVKDTVYDTLGRVAQTTLAYEDSGSSLTSPTTNGDLVTNYAYDPMSRVAEITNAIGVTSYIYDDWMTTVTNQNGIPKDLSKDAYGRLVQVIEHNDSNTYETNYTWNLNNKLLQIEDALGNVRNFEYDNLGRRTLAEDLHDTGDNDFGTWTYTYDLAGNLAEYLDPNGATVLFSHDELNRIRQEDSNTTSGVTDIIYTYDTCQNGIGRLCQAENADGVIVDYSYLENGMQGGEIRNINGESFDMAYTYDRQGNIDTIQNPDRSVVDYTRNEAGLIESIQQVEDGGSMIDFVSDIDYGPHGLPTEISYYNGVTTINTYDATKMYRLENVVTTSPGSGDIQDVTYSYDDMNNITNISDASATTASKEAEYTYDDLDRLLSATVTNTGNSADYTVNYEYDAIGNIINTSTLGDYTYAGNGSSYANPHAVTDINSVVYEYDNNGNLTTDSSITNTWTYRNELLETSGPGGTLNFLYDYEGQRMYVNNGTDIDYYPSKYYNAIAGIPTKNVYLDDILVGTIENSGTNAIYHWNHSDHLTGSNVTTDDTGTLEQTLDYLPFGEVRINDQVTMFDQGRKFSGAVHDRESGYSYMGSRYEDGRIGRFVSQDPVFVDMGTDTKMLEKLLTDPQMLNSYSYAKNNPLAYVDPNGEFAQIIAGLAILAVNAPAINSFLQSLTTPLGQFGVSQAMDDAKNGNYGMAVIGAVTAGEFKTAGAGIKGVQQIADEISGAKIATGLEKTTYDSFLSFKNAAGSAGEGNHWHHIVEQNPVNMARFDSQQINSVENLVSIPKELHYKITGLYNSKPAELGGMRFRDFVNQQSFTEQFKIGKEIMKRFTKK